MFTKFRTLEQIQSCFTKAIKDLDDLSVRNREVINHNKAAIDRLGQRNEELVAENLKASRFAENLEKLLGE